MNALALSAPMVMSARLKLLSKSAEGQGKDIWNTRRSQ